MLDGRYVTEMELHELQELGYRLQIRLWQVEAEISRRYAKPFRFGTEDANLPQTITSSVATHQES